IPILAVDGWNWTKYHKNRLPVAAKENLVQQYDGTDMQPVDVMSDEVKAWQGRSATITKQYIAATIPDALFIHIMHLKTARELFQYLASLFEMK
ncbi:hypothetical protein BU15DRAFT_37601, partial [Melanogaster broomeanus]